jgi:hypothetical protein
MHILSPHATMVCVYVYIYKQSILFYEHLPMRNEGLNVGFQRNP